jgi:hypothetical protein
MKLAFRNRTNREILRTSANSDVLALPDASPAILACRPQHPRQPAPASPPASAAIAEYQG